MDIANGGTFILIYPRHPGHPRFMTGIDPLGVFPSLRFILRADYS